MRADVSSAQILSDLRRLARQRRPPVQSSDVAALLARLVAACGPLEIEEGTGGIVLRLAARGSEGLSLTCFVHRARSASLSDTERAVARELCTGKTLAQIARLRGVSPNTIKSQVRVIFRKLDVESRVALVHVLGP